VKNLSNQQRWPRTAVAVDSTGRVLLIVSESATLAEFVEGLLRLNSTLQIQSALNLDGGFSSGLMYQEGKQQYRQVGSTKTLIGSAILVQPRPESVPPPDCLTEKIEVREMVPFEIEHRSIYVYLASLPLGVHGKADILIFGNGLWTGPRREMKKSVVTDQLKQFNKESYRETTIRSKHLSQVDIDGASYVIKVDTSYQGGFAKITLCPGK
jgi:hypothetical protein